MNKPSFMLVAAGLVGVSALAQMPGEPAAARAARKGQPDVAARGETLFAYHCAACHAAGPGHPGTAALAFRDEGAANPVLSERGDLPPEMVAYVVRNGMNAMPFFRKTEISDADLAAIGAYLARPKKR